MRCSGLLAAISWMSIVTGASAETVTFEEADVDGDGALTQEEISAAFGADLVSRILAAEDANGDGVLSRGEAENALAEDADWREYEAPDVPEEPLAN